MRSIMREYAQKNSVLVISCVICGVLTLGADSLFVQAMERIESSGITLYLFVTILIYIGLRLLNGYRLHILNEMVENSIASYLRKKTVLGLTSRCEMLEGNELLMSKNIPEIAEYMISKSNTVFSVLSIFITNIVLLITQKWMSLILFASCFLVLLISAVITRKVGDHYQRYITQASDSMDFQHNILQNSKIVQGENAHVYIVGTFYDRMSRERHELDSFLRSRIAPERFSEGNYVISNVLLPIVSLVFVLLELESPIFLIQMMVLSPHLTSMTNSIAFFFLSYRENQTIMRDLVNKICENKEENPIDVASNLDDAEDKNNICIQVNGVIPHVRKRVSFNIDTFGVYCIKGCSGSGKTTLLRILARELSAQSRKFTIAYFDVKSFYLVNDTIENLSIYLGKTKEFVLNLLERYCTDLHIDKNVYLKETSEGYENLSDGQKRLLVLFAAIYCDAPVVLLDEPTANLDATTRHKAISIIRQLSMEKIVIVTSHDSVLNEVTKAVICHL